jgi:hypothetical protein
VTLAWILVAFVVVFVVAVIGAMRGRDNLHAVNAVIAAVCLALIIWRILRP